MTRITKVRKIMQLEINNAVTRITEVEDSAIKAV